MKRVIISVCILSAMISLGVLFNIRISAECKKLIGFVELTEKSMDSENTEQAFLYMQDFKDEWDSFYNEALFILRGDRLSDIDSCYVRIIPLIKTDNDELSAELAELKNLLVRTKESEFPSIFNIL